MPVLAAGFMGLAVEVKNGRPVEVGGAGYERPPVSWTGHPMQDLLPAMAGIEAPRYGEIRICALYDAPSAGRCLLWFRLTPPIVEIPFAGLLDRNWPSRTVTFVPDFRLGLAISAARTGADTAITIGEGNQFALADNQPVFAGVKLTLERDTGRLIANATATKAEADRRHRVAASGAS